MKTATQRIAEVRRQKEKEDRALFQRKQDGSRDWFNCTSVVYAVAVAIAVAGMVMGGLLGWLISRGGQ